MNATKKLALSLILCAPALACSPSAERDPGGGATGATGGASGGSTSSGGGGLTSSGGSTGVAGSGVIVGGMGTEEDCGRKNFMSDPKPAHVLLVLDRSASMKDNVAGDAAPEAEWKWTLVVPALKEVIAETNTAVNWGLKVFPEGAGSECVTGSVTSRIEVPVGPMNATTVNAAIDATTPEGNGTPTGDAVRASVPHLQAITEEGPKYLLLATDGEPSCAGTTQGQATARPFAVQAVTEAAAAGFHTFVVGVATTSTNPRQALNDMAVAGLEPNPASVNPLADKFYLATTRDQLVQALRVITGEVASCVFPLDGMPPVVENIGVRVGTELAPKDTTHTNGWDYTDSTYTSVELYGEWCDRVKTATAKSVEIIFACRGDVIR